MVPTVLLYFENCRLTNTGTITSTGDNGSSAVYFGYETNIVLNNSGTIESGTNGVAGGMTRAINSGDIIGVGVGMADWSEESFSLTNTGLIIGGYAGVTSYTGYDKVSLIVNYGTISGLLDPARPGFSIRLEGIDGTGRIVNDGSLIGDVTMECNRNVLTNSGTIDGDVLIFGNLSNYISTSTGVVLGDIIVSGGPARMQGGDSSDRLFGGESNDVIGGGGGDDLLNGGAARDILTGGTGADRFVFSSAEDITTSYYGSDRITDFQTGIDHIDLSAFMPTGQFIGGARFHGIAGEVRYNATTGQLVGDTDGDRVFDWSMVFSNKAALTAADFIF
jgi:Ca2+-binding RTX toxin-like protein